MGPSSVEWVRISDSEPYGPRRRNLTARSRLSLGGRLERRREIGYDGRPMGVSVFFAAAALVGLALAATPRRGVRGIRHLPPRAAAGPPPRVSVVVAARDEEGRIE